MTTKREEQRKRLDAQEEIFKAKAAASERFLLQVARWCAVSLQIKPTDVRNIAGEAGRLGGEMETYLGQAHFTRREISDAVWSYAKRNEF